MSASYRLNDQYDWNRPVIASSQHFEPEKDSRVSRRLQVVSAVAGFHRVHPSRNRSHRRVQHQIEVLAHILRQEA